MFEWTVGTWIVGALIWVAMPFFLKATVLRPATCKSTRKLDGKVCLVTGASSGLGKVTTMDLSFRGAVVYMACRNMEKAKGVRREILLENPSAKLKLLKLDLGSLKSVRECAEAFQKEEEKLDILVANAGFGTFEFQLTEDGIEWHLACNHLGHFYLARLLLPCLEKAGTAEVHSRIVVVSSIAHCLGYSVIKYDILQKGEGSGHSYGQSKLANLLFVKHLDKVLAGRKITVNGLHPGFVRTDFLRYYMQPVVQKMVGVLIHPLSCLLLTEVEGAQTQIWACVAEDLEGVSGKYLKNCSVSSPSKCAQNSEEAEKLWRWSCSKTRLPIDL